MDEEVARRRIDVRLESVPLGVPISRGVARVDRWVHEAAAACQADIAVKQAQRGDARVRHDADKARVCQATIAAVEGQQERQAGAAPVRGIGGIRIACVWESVTVGIRASDHVDADLALVTGPAGVGHRVGDGVGPGEAGIRGIPHGPRRTVATLLDVQNRGGPVGRIAHRGDLEPVARVCGVAIVAEGLYLPPTTRDQRPEVVVDRHGRGVRRGDVLLQRDHDVVRDKSRATDHEDPDRIQSLELVRHARWNGVPRHEQQWPADLGCGRATDHGVGHAPVAVGDVEGWNTGGVVAPADLGAGLVVAAARLTPNRPVGEIVEPGDDAIGDVGGAADHDDPVWIQARQLAAHRVRD